MTGTVLRLRHAVQASPTAAGLHVRGWMNAFTADGGADLWRLWQRLEPALRSGIAVDRLDRLTTRPRTRVVLRALIDALREHDMTLDLQPALAYAHQPAPPAVAAWLEQLTADPAAAWHRLAGRTVTVTGTGPVADAAVAALTATGLPVTVRPDTEDTRMVGVTAGRHVTVVAGLGDGAGFVTEPTPVADAAQLAARIAGRLKLITARRVPAGPMPAILGAAAAHRLICHSAGLNDPARSRTSPDETGPDPWSMVLVARSEPLTTGFHPWLAGGGVPAGAADTLEDALHRLDALCDPELGMLPAAETGTLPQVPMSLARSGAEVGLGVTLGAARLDATLRAAERRLDPSGTGRLAVGADTTQAEGILLRRELLDRTPAGPARNDPSWETHPTARRWLRTVRDRFGVDVECVVAPIVPGVWTATVTDRRDVLGRAVEATPGDAAAFALLHAVAAAQTDLPSAATGPLTCCGAVAPARPFADADWMSGPWTWPGTRPAERELQRALRRLIAPERHPRPVTRRHAGDLGDALHAAGFVIRRTRGHHD
ncbi:hypothetical protein [Actinoplanes sp. HUAS TT8]|uniref:hypothetical protein n=1 Tax=Actinoplanes sp. HUAS TT8 TaxID=3447453 RepID=UPI003F525C30